ncbi:MAG: L-serine ammonia-lyase, iron-sulfur-dependent, subunit alpha [Erysipelotrichaceae bacterium]|nr:L-serine ammonia-lyase, iron-sulfur-dependent, subunit alpha [Erysipelotrichaceae bacterium]
MHKEDQLYKEYLAILKEELIPAMGCTEPIALAYAASKAKEVLGELPDKVVVEASGSIIKNVKSVIVPNTNQLKGISAAVAAGIVAGNCDRELEVISEVDEQKKQEIAEYLRNTLFEEKFLDEGNVFDLIVTLYKDKDYSKVRISHYHTNIVLIERNGEVLFKKEDNREKTHATNRNCLNMEAIYDFSNTVDIEDVRETIERQIEYNTSIALEGLKNNYGANIGKVLLKHGGDSVAVRAKAMAASASDARMNGCEMPVIINSGSGNQGITCSLPVIEYAKEYNIDKDKLIRALVLSNLVAIHEKTRIGTLSAFCGAVSAGASAGAGIAYLLDGSYDAIIHTVVNALAISSGIICDGAKASCAAKISTSVDAGIFGYQMYLEHQEFKGGDGIVVKGIENTIRNIGRLSSEGMRETNKEIISMMIEK